jgi:PAS domain S-box-containing protein
MKTNTENKRLAAEVQRLKEENSSLRKKERCAIRYIRDKVDQLLVIMGTVPLKPEELEDDTLIDLDPIGIVSDSFSQVLANVRTTNENLHVAKDEIEAIINSVQAGILVMNSKCKILSYNQKMADLFNESTENIMGLSCNEVLCDKVKPDESCVIKKILAGEKDAVKKGWSCRGRFYDVTATPIMDSSGRLSHIVVLYIDITQRKEAEDGIKESEQRYRDLFENANDLIQIVGPDGHIDYVNRTWRDTLGYNEHEISKLTVFDLIHPDCISHCRDLFKKVVQGEHVDKFETKFMAKDGREILLEGTTSCKFEDGKAVSTRGIFRDITEKRRMEEELYRTQKLESVGILAGGIAHDFNNLLAAILGNISLAEMEVQPDSTISQRLSNATNACSRAKDLTQQLLTFAKGGVPIIQTTSIGDLIRDCVGFTLRGSNVKCDCLLPDDLWPVEADVGQISQVLQNLLINGAQAMLEGGIIRVRSENITLTTNELSLQQGRYVKITVSDHGPGIAPEHLKNIFDPYFTTKEMGSGLGLAISFSIIHKHGGLITVDSEQGKGSSFFIYLPASENVHSVNDEESASAPATVNTCKVLFMDDEEIVREMASKMLTILGHDVYCVEDGKEALEAFREAIHSGTPFDLVIMDLTIPGGMGGQEAVQKVLQIDPQARVIVSSGYSTDPVMARYSDYGFCGMTTKPYSFDELKKTVADALTT